MFIHICSYVHIYIMCLSDFIIVLPSFFFLWLQFCASSLKEAEEWVKEIDFVLRGPNTSRHVTFRLNQTKTAKFPRDKLG